MDTPEFNFDPSTALDTYRSVFAPTLRAQQEALKTSTQFGEKLQGRVREFMNLASETRASFNQLLGEATARLAETIKQSP